MGFRLTRQERRIVAFVGIALVAGGLVKLLRSFRTDVPSADRHLLVTSQPQGPVNLNTGGPRDLQRLPGIGPALAARIISHRQQHGPFQSVEQLADVRGLGPKTIARLETLVTLGASGVLDTSASPTLDR